MDRWTCPDCGREFGRRRQAHTCSPGLTVEEYFATAQPWERPIHDVVAPHLRSLGEVIVDPISIGIRFKNGPTFCTLRAMKKWTALEFMLERRLSSSRLSRKVVEYHGRYHHTINVDDASAVDEEVLGWLSESYHTAGGTLHLLGSVESDGTDPMVPDDVIDPFA